MKMAGNFPVRPEAAEGRGTNRRENGRLTGEAEAGGEMECAALADLAVAPDATAHQGYQVGANSQAETGSAVFARG